MYMKNKRLLTSVAKIRKVPIYLFYFLKDNSMVHVCGNFVVYSMSLSNFRGGRDSGAEFPTALCNLKRIIANEKGKLSKAV